VYSYYYYFNKSEQKDEKYRTIFNTIGCVEGNREYLLDEVKKNNSFCRNQEGIDYNYFLSSMKQDDIVIYITESTNIKILGACSISIYHTNIDINSICVPPTNSDVGIKKRIGSLLLNKIKELAQNILSVTRILVTFSSNSTVKDFYIKNNFTETDERLNNVMIFRVREGGRRRRKTNNKRKTKQRNQKTRKFKRTSTNQP